MATLNLELSAEKLAWHTDLLLENVPRQQLPYLEAMSTLTRMDNPKAQYVEGYMVRDKILIPYAWVKDGEDIIDIRAVDDGSTRHYFGAAAYTYDVLLNVLKSKHSHRIDTPLSNRTEWFDTAEENAKQFLLRDSEITENEIRESLLDTANQRYKDEDHIDRGLLILQELADIEDRSEEEEAAFKGLSDYCVRSGDEWIVKPMDRERFKSYIRRNFPASKK